MARAGAEGVSRAHSVTPVDAIIRGESLVGCATPFVAIGRLRCVSRLAVDDSVQVGARESARRHARTEPQPLDFFNPGWQVAHPQPALEISSENSVGYRDRSAGSQSPDEILA